MNLIAVTDETAQYADDPLSALNRHYLERLGREYRPVPMVAMETGETFWRGKCQPVIREAIGPLERHPV